MYSRYRNASETAPSRLRCAIYTRKSTEEGLDQEFNSLDAQREAAQSAARAGCSIAKPATHGWCIPIRASSTAAILITFA
jgi:hypothetical protein